MFILEILNGFKVSCLKCVLNDVIRDYLKINIGLFVRSGVKSSSCSICLGFKGCCGS